MNPMALMQGPQQQGGPMYPGGMPGPGGAPMGGGGPAQGGQPQIPPQVLQMLLMKLMQQQGMGQQQMAPPEQTPYEKWAAPGSIGSIPPGTTPLNKINGTPPGGPQGPMPTPTYTTGVRG